MIPQEILDYVDFRTGTYWIFQDSSTRRIDSTIVISSKHVMEDIKEDNKCGDVILTRQYENIEMVLERYDSLGKLVFTSVREFNNEYKKHDHSLDKVFVIDNYNSFSIGYPFDQIYNSEGYIINEYKLDSMEVKGRVYHDILNVKGAVNGSGTEYFINSYSKNIGKIHNIGYHNGIISYKGDLIRYKIK